MSQSAQFAQLKTVFFEECQELLADVEQKLTDIEEGRADLETTNAIFRAVHSIKAGGGVFDFKGLVAFAHVFEAFLDKLRNEEISLSAEVSELLFEGNDVLANHIEGAQAGAPLAETHGADTLAKLASYTDLEPPAVAADDDDDDDDFGIFADEDIAAGAQQRWVIEFKPFKEVFRHANEPLLIIRELMTLGSVDVQLNSTNLPAFGDMDPEDCYFSWTLTLTTSASRAEIDEVFEFVIDDCDLTISEGAGADDPATPAAADQNSGAEDTVANDAAPIVPPQVTTALADQAAKQAADSGTSDGQNPTPAGDGKPKMTSIRVELDRVDRLVNMVGELVITQSMLTQELQNLNAGQNARLLTGMEELAAHARELQENVMAVRMQPVKSVFSRMPRLVRDLSRQLGKKVKLNTAGETTEVDKTVIEEIADPLTHMIRNSLDHGLETPDEREAAGKPAEGNIWLRAEHRGGRIIIEVEDDGFGIKRDKVLAKAIDKGLVEESDKLSDEDIDNLIFHPGFSTADQVTNVSGRGVGMDVVRKNIMSLGGRISVSSVTGKGSKFTLALPLTLAVLDGMIVRTGDQKYVLPVNSIIESIRPLASDVKTLFGGSKVVRVRGDYIPLVQVSEATGVSGAETEPDKALVVIVETDAGGPIGLVVDELLGQQQVVIKSLEANYTRIEGISAATILGNGQVCLILDIDGLEEIERRTRGSANLSQQQMREAFETAEQSSQEAQHG